MNYDTKKNYLSKIQYRKEFHICLFLMQGSVSYQLENMFKDIFLLVRLVRGHDDKKGYKSIFKNLNKFTEIKGQRIINNKICVFCLNNIFGEIL